MSSPIINWWSLDVTHIFAIHRLTLWPCTDQYIRYSNKRVWHPSPDTPEHVYLWLGQWIEGTVRYITVATGRRGDVSALCTTQIPVIASVPLMQDWIHSNPAQIRVHSSRYLTHTSLRPGTGAGWQEALEVMSHTRRRVHHVTGWVSVAL